MPQFGRPSADISTGTWTTTPLWEKLDESSPDDTTTEVTTANNPSNVAFEVRVTGITDPEDNTGHVVRVRVKKSASGGRTINFAFTLLQGSTTIATWSASNVTNSYATFTRNLTTGEAGNITNYADLRVRVSANNPDTGPGRSAQCTWIEMEAPDAPAPPDPIDETITETSESAIEGEFELAFVADGEVSEATTLLVSELGDSLEEIIEEAIESAVTGDFEIEFEASEELGSLAVSVSEELAEEIAETISEELSSALSGDFEIQFAPHTEEQEGSVTLAVSDEIEETVSETSEAVLGLAEDQAVGETVTEASEATLSVAESVEAAATVNETSEVVAALTVSEEVVEIVNEGSSGSLSVVEDSGLEETIIEGLAGTIEGDFEIQLEGTSEDLTGTLLLDEDVVGVEEPVDETLAVALEGLVEIGFDVDFVLPDEGMVGSVVVVEDVVGTPIEETVTESLGSAVAGEFEIQLESDIEGLTASVIVNETLSGQDEPTELQLEGLVEMGFDIDFTLPDEGMVGVIDIFEDVQSGNLYEETIFEGLESGVDIDTTSSTVILVSEGLTGQTLVDEEREGPELIEETIGEGIVGHVSISYLAVPGSDTPTLNPDHGDAELVFSLFELHTQVRSERGGRENIREIEHMLDFDRRGGGTDD